MNGKTGTVETIFEVLCIKKYIIQASVVFKIKYFSTEEGM